LACAATALAGAALAAPACSGKVSGQSTDGGGTSGDVFVPDAMLPTGNTTAGQPPPAPMGAPPAMKGGGTRAFAMDLLQLGGTDRQGAPGADAWKQYGYDIDGKTTNTKSTDVCTQSAGAMKSAQSDGNGGIDNSFGENILPIMTSVQATFEQDANKSIASGTFTLLFVVDGLTDDATQTNVGLHVSVFTGASFGGQPTFTKADDWPIDPSSIVPGSTPPAALATAADAYVTQGTLVAHFDSLTVPLGLMTLPLKHVVVSFLHAPATSLSNGTISGVADTAAFLAVLKTSFTRLSTSLCDGAAFDQIVQEFDQAQDILVDGTNSPGVACNAFSVGLGFAATEVGTPDKVAQPLPPMPDPCGD
jgi:hypothetical protein